jgi:hypothetical protein
MLTVMRSPFALQQLDRPYDAIEGAVLHRRPLVRVLGRALDRDAPSEGAAGLDDLVEEGLARRLHAVGEEDDLLEAERHRVPHDVHEAGLERGLAAEEGELAMPVCVRLADLVEDGRDIHRPGAPERGLLARDTEHATVVAHVPELDLDLLSRLHAVHSSPSAEKSSMLAPNAGREARQRRVTP